MDFPLPVWSYSVPSVSVELLDPENRGVAVGILSLGGIEPKIRWGYFFTPNYNIRVCKKRLTTAGLNQSIKTVSIISLNCQSFISLSVNCYNSGTQFFFLSLLKLQREEGTSPSSSQVISPCLYPKCYIFVNPQIALAGDYFVVAFEQELDLNRTDYIADFRSQTVHSLKQNRTYYLPCFSQLAAVHDCH